MKSSSVARKAKRQPVQLELPLSLPVQTQVKRKQRGLIATTIAGAGKSGFFLLPGIFMFSAMLYGNPSIAAVTRCEKSQPVKGCVSSFKELDKEQLRLNQFDQSLNLKADIVNVFQPVNGKRLTMEYWGQHSLKISFTKSKVEVIYNGKASDDIKICYEACPKEKRVTWYTDKYGEFRKISNGLSVGTYEFKIDSAN